MSGAAEGQHALRKVGVYHGRIDALLTDVIMRAVLDG